MVSFFLLKRPIQVVWGCLLLRNAVGKVELMDFIEVRGDVVCFLCEFVFQGLQRLLYLDLYVFGYSKFRNYKNKSLIWILEKPAKRRFRLKQRCAPAGIFIKRMKLIYYVGLSCKAAGCWEICCSSCVLFDWIGKRLAASLLFCCRID